MTDERTMENGALAAEEQALALVISRQNDTDTSEWDDCLLMARAIIEAGYARAQTPAPVERELRKEILDWAVKARRNSLSGSLDERDAWSHFDKWLTRLADRYAALRSPAPVERELREALRPFAEAARHLDPNWHGDTEVSEETPGLTYEHLRQSARVYHSPAPQEQAQDGDSIHRLSLAWSNHWPEPESTEALQAVKATVAQLRAELGQALREVVKWSREAGEAKGKLEGSEMAGAVRGWQERATKAEAELKQKDKELWDGSDAAVTLSRRTIKAEAELGRVTRERDSWLNACVRQQNRADAAEAKLAAAPGDAHLHDLVAWAYEQGCNDTHKSIQAEPELALNTYPEFGEAAQDYATSALSQQPQGEGR